MRGHGPPETAIIGRHGPPGAAVEIMRKGGMAATLGGARKMRDAALAAVAGLFLLGALAGGGRRTSTENLMSVAYGLLPISERVSFSQAAAQCPVTEEVRAGVWAAVCPTGDELMWCSRMADAVDGDVVDATKCEDDTWPGDGGVARVWRLVWKCASGARGTRSSGEDTLPRRWQHEHAVKF